MFFGNLIINESQHIKKEEVSNIETSSFKLIIIVFLTSPK